MTAVSGLAVAPRYKLAQSEDAQKVLVRFMVFCPTINIPRVRCWTVGPPVTITVIHLQGHPVASLIIIENYISNESVFDSIDK